MRELTPVPCTPCTCTDHDPCIDRSGSERTRYYHRQLVGPEDLTQDQVYFRERLRRHNRIMHGWGVVCGVPVEQTVVIEDGEKRPKPFSVTVGAGYILGPYGDEIIIDRDVCLDIQRETMDGLLQDPCGDRPRDPWCIDVQVDRVPDRTYYLAVKWAECDVRPVRAATGCGCGCDDAACEYSRIRDGFALALLDELPSGHTNLNASPLEPGFGYESFMGRISCAEGASRDCPECPQSPWVVLADIAVKPDGSLQAGFDHRRRVASFGPYVFGCGAPSRENSRMAASGPSADPASHVKKHAMAAFQDQGGDTMALLRLPLGMVLDGIPRGYARKEDVNDIPLGDLVPEPRTAFSQILKLPEDDPDVEKLTHHVHRLFSRLGLMRQ